MNFNLDVAQQAALNKQSCLPLPDDLKDILVSQVIGRMTALLARRMDAKIAMYLEIPLLAPDGQPLLDSRGEATKPSRIADSQFHRQNELLTILAEWDDGLAKSLQQAVIQYERQLLASAAKSKGKKTVKQILEEAGPFWSQPGFWQH